MAGAQSGGVALEREGCGSSCPGPDREGPTTLVLVTGRDQLSGIQELGPETERKHALWFRKGSYLLLGETMACL